MDDETKLTSCVNLHNYLDRNFIVQLVEVEFLMNFEQKKNRNFTRNVWYWRPFVAAAKGVLAL